MSSWISTLVLGRANAWDLEYVLSADEKTIQVLARCHPGVTAVPGYEQRVEFEYEHLGTVAYHTTWDVFQSRII